MARVNTLSIDNTTYAIGTEYFGYCNTGSTTNAKIITTLQTAGFGLNNGTILHVIFSNNHTSGGVMQLNVNNTGAKNVLNKVGKNVYYLPKGYYCFVYYNNYWYMNGKAYEDLQVTGTGNAITSIDALDWTNGIKATKGNVEAYFSNKLMPNALFNVAPEQFTGSGTYAKFWTGEYGSYISGLMSDGTLNFNNIDSTTASKNNRFYVYMWNPNEESLSFKITGCYISYDSDGEAQNGYINILSRKGVILKCSNNNGNWWVEVVRFKKI